MKKYFIIYIFIASFLAMFYNAPLVLAQACSPDGSQQAGNNICNPVPGMFVDLTTLGSTNTFAGLLKYAVQIILPITGILAVFFLIWGGYQYIASGANEELAEQGKKTLRNALIGLVVVLLSYVIVVAVINTLFNN